MSERASLADAGVGLVDALGEYVASLLKLQGFRLEAGARAALRRLALFLAGLALAAFGFILLSYGLVLWLASQIGSLAGSFSIVGFACLLLGGLVILTRAAKVPRPRRHQFRGPLEVPDA